MVVAQLLAFEQFVQVCLHQILHDVAEVGARGLPGGGSGRQLVKKNRSLLTRFHIPPADASGTQQICQLIS